MIDNNLQWERVRYISAITKNSGIVARGGKNPRLYEPREMFKLPQDNAYESVRGRAKSDKKTYLNFLDKVRMAGFIVAES